MCFVARCRFGAHYSPTQLGFNSASLSRPTPLPRQRSASHLPRNVAAAQAMAIGPVETCRARCRIVSSSSSHLPPGERNPASRQRQCRARPRACPPCAVATACGRSGTAWRPHLQGREACPRSRFLRRAQQRNQDAEAAAIEHAAARPALSVRNPSPAPTLYASPARAAVKLGRCTPSSRAKSAASIGP